MRVRGLTFHLLLLCQLFPPGCASSGPSPLSFSVRRVPQRDRAAAFDAAEDALINLGYRIDRRDPTAGLLTTRPVEGTGRDQPVHGSLQIASRGPFRRVAQVQLEETAEGLKVYCRVVVQRQTTQAHRLLAVDRTASDAPGRTPIEREAATTTEQNTVWQTIRRDTAAERRLLEAITGRPGQTSR